MNRIVSLSFFLVSLLLSVFILVSYTLPFKIILIIFPIVIAFYFFIGEKNAFLVSMSFIVITLIIEIFLRVIGIENNLYYRFHERFSIHDRTLGFRHYEKNVRFEMKMPHGDLKALARDEEVPSESRKVTVFHTDSFGFRNSRDYHGQKYLLVGDSFIVGSGGATQSEILSEQLFNRYGIDVYNLAHPGDMREYLKYIKAFSKSFKGNYKVILFLFEGNDFPQKEIKKVAETTPKYLEPLYSLRNYLRKMLVYRFVYSTTRRIFHRGKLRKIEVKKVGNLSMAFLEEYITVSKREYSLKNSEISEYIKEIKDRTTHIFFIPTKYRVYYNYINQNSQEDLPNQQLEFTRKIGKELDIQVIDLTPDLIKESDLLIKEGKLTFWRDDTHWNENGIAVAASSVANNVFKIIE